MVPAPPVLAAMLRAHHAAYGTAPAGRHARRHPGSAWRFDRKGILRVDLSASPDGQHLYRSPGFTSPTPPSAGPALAGPER